MAHYIPAHVTFTNQLTPQGQQHFAFARAHNVRTLPIPGRLDWHIQNNQGAQTLVRNAFYRTLVGLRNHRPTARMRVTIRFIANGAIRTVGYTLTQNTMQDLITAFNDLMNGRIDEDDIQGSDERVAIVFTPGRHIHGITWEMLGDTALQHMGYANAAAMQQWIGHAQQGGQFFNKLLAVDLPEEFVELFAPLQIYQTFVLEQEPCLIHALRQLKVPDDTIAKAQEMMYGVRVPKIRLKKIAIAMEVHIRLTTLQAPDAAGRRRWRRTEYNVGHGEPLDIALHDDHYFPLMDMDIDKQALSNVWNVAIPNWWKRVGYAAPTCSLRVLELMLERKDFFFRDIPTEQLMQTIHYDHECPFDGPEVPLSDSSYVEHAVDPRVELGAKHLKTVLPAAVEGIGKTDWPKLYDAPKKYFRVFFDFETATHEGSVDPKFGNLGHAHLPYLCATHSEEEGTHVYQYANEMLDGLVGQFGHMCGKDGSFIQLYAHNSSYDWCFIADEFSSWSKHDVGTQMIAGEGYYRGVLFKVQNTLKKIPMGLGKFGKTFKLDQKKEVMPYDMYRTLDDCLPGRLVPLAECLTYVKPEDRDAYEANCREWDGVLNDEGQVDVYAYSAWYCRQDVEVLAKGYLAFRQLIYDITELDIDCMFTLPSIGMNYAIKFGAFDGVEEIQGLLREYIGNTIVGGRTMVRRNEKCEYDAAELHEDGTPNGPMEDMDAVSLYLSSGCRLRGFPKGKASNFDMDQSQVNIRLDMEQMETYYCKIRILSVEHAYDIPLLSRRTEEGGREWTNDMVGEVCYVNDIVLEDWVNFHGITYEVINGIYFDSGSNALICELYRGLFERRLEAKKNKNTPLSNVLKLLANAIYGRTLLKPRKTNVVYKTVGQEWDHFSMRHAENIVNFQPSGTSGKVMRVEVREPVFSHSNYSQCGSLILGMSKRIMGEYTCLAQDMYPGCIYYTDTDSTQIPARYLSPIADMFLHVYGRELMGSGIGQFHVDFEMDGCVDVNATKAVFLGKKSYACYLQGKDEENGKTTHGIHYRMKGINHMAIVCRAKDVYPDLPHKRDRVFSLYRENLFKGQEVEFDLLSDGCVSFEIGKDGKVRSRAQFLRSVKF